MFDKIPVATRRVQQEWQDSNCDALFGFGVLLAFTCSTSIVKLLWQDNGVHPYIIDPEKFGVYMETVSMLDRQPAFGHKYNISIASLRTMLQDHPRRAELMAQITPQREQDEQETGYKTIVMSASQPNLVGNVAMPDVGYTEPVAHVDADVAELLELYVYDDDKKDFMVVTMAEPHAIIYERPLAEIFYKGEIPFVKITPNPDEFYFWGRSETAKLRPLQDWLNERLLEIRRLLNRQARPPSVGSGLLGDESEIQDALTTPGRYVPADGTSTFNFKELRPNISYDLFRDVNSILDMFNQVSGIPRVMQGLGDAGIRSDQHARTLALMGSSRVKKRALVIEDALEKIATLMYKLLRRHSADHLIDTKGQEFLLAQVSDDVTVKVDAHSNSPAFSEELRDYAFAANKAGLIDSDEFFELTNPPRKEMLKQTARKLAEQRARQKQADDQRETVIELAKHRHK